MKISGPADKWQPLLFDVPKDESKTLTVAACRNYCGEFMEEATKALAGGTKLSTDNRADICPDLLLPDGSYAEVKSIGTNKEVLVYEARIEKDLELLQDNRLVYFLWHHRFKVSEGITQRELWDGLAAETMSVHVYSAQSLISRMKDATLMLVNKKGGRRGWGSYGYTHGRRMRLHRLDIPLASPEPIGIKVHGRPMVLPAYVECGLNIEFNT